MSHSKFKNIIEVLDHHIPQPIDRLFMNKVLTYVNNFIHRDENTINFFGSNLIGVYPIKWLESDEGVSWIYDVLEIDDFNQLKNDIFDLPDFKRNFQVASNPYNLSMLWIVYKAVTSTILNEKDRDHLARASLNMLQYKFISSLHTRRFPHKADIGIAIAVYEQLDNKSTLKAEGTWQGVVDARTTDILGSDSIHANVVKTFQKDYDVVKMLNDIETRLRSIFNILTRDFHLVIKSNTKFTSTGKFVTIDGELVLKDSINEYTQIKRNLQFIIQDKNSFINDNLIDIIILSVPTVYKTYLKNTLEYISNNFKQKIHHVNIMELVDNLIMFSFDIINSERIDIKDIASVTIKMRNMLKSSRVVAPEFIRIKEQMGIIVEEANFKISDINMASTRIGVLLYIITRSLIKNPTGL